MLKVYRFFIGHIFGVLGRFQRGVPRKEWIKMNSTFLRNKRKKIFYDHDTFMTKISAAFPERVNCVKFCVTTIIPELSNEGLASHDFLDSRQAALIQNIFWGSRKTINSQSGESQKSKYGGQTWAWAWAWASGSRQILQN